MKLPFALAKFSDFFSDESVADAEAHISDGRIGSLEEIEKKLWICKYEEGAQLYEIEIMLVGKKVKDFACDCGLIEKDCRHAFFALEELNERFEDAIDSKIKLAENKKKKAPIKPQTIKNIIQSVEFEELKKFVADVSSSNKNFEMAVRARFGLDAEGQNIETSSKEIFTKLIAKARTSYGDINPKGWEQLITFLDGIKFKIENCFQHQNFANALEFWYCYTHFILRLHRSDFSVGKKLEKRRQFSNDFLAAIHPMVVAPELKEKLRQYLLTLAQAYVKLAESQTIVNYAFKEKIFTEENTLELLGSIREALSKSSLYFEEQIYLELLEINFLYKLNKNEEARRILRVKKRNSNLYLNVVYNCIEGEDYNEAKFLIEQGKLMYTEPEISFGFHRLEYALALKQNNVSEIKNLAYKLLITSNQKSFLDVLYEHNVSGETLEKLTKVYEAKMSDSESREVLAYIYSKKEDWEAIIKLIEKTNDVELFGEYAKELYAIDAEKTKERFLSAFIKFLKTSSGSSLVERLHSVFQELFHRETEPLVKFLVKGITVEFKSRHYLRTRLYAFLTREEI